MTATLSRNTNCVTVRIDGELSYGVWKTLRDARETAHHSHLPLSLDIQSCSRIDMAGIGAVMIAQERLACVQLRGCHAKFVEHFEAFGICAHCGTATTSDVACPKKCGH